MQLGLTVAPLSTDRADLAARNLGFVTWLARDYRNRGLALEDLVAEGSLGLLEAARRYDPERGIKFTTYAAWWIRKAILAALEATPIVRRPSAAPQHERAFRRRAVSLDAEPLASRLPDPHALDPETVLLDDESGRCMRAAVVSLPPLERTVLEHRFGLENRPTLSLRETGHALGLCGERVRQIERRSLERVRRSLVRSATPAYTRASRVAAGEMPGPRS